MLPTIYLPYLALSILLLPLLQAGLLLLWPTRRPGGWAVGISAAGAILASLQLAQVLAVGGFSSSWPWFTLAGNLVELGLWVNLPSAVLSFLVTFISLLVQLFSTEYMRGDARRRHYFAYLGLFAFSMLGIVLADNLLLIFCFWEGVGLSSYLLIGFWRTKSRAANAAKKAFLVNRIGDAGFLMALALLYAALGTFHLPTIFKLMPAGLVQQGIWLVDMSPAALSFPQGMLFLIGLGLAMGAIGKSAQFPLQVWLPDAMQGPTPVSALLHAATMVAAGVYLLVRVFPLLSPEVLLLLAIIGAITAFMGAFAAFTQHDIKRVLAFSTISQLGYMTMAVGTGSPEAGFFHLTTHAFFKAGLFLAAGAVIYALHRAQHSSQQNFDAQDMRHMGGLRTKMPFTFLCYLLCMLSLAGLPFFSGYLSKDALLTQALGWADVSSARWGVWVWLVPLTGFFSAAMTAVYMGRQLFFVFYGESKLPLNTYRELREVGWAMRLPLASLALLSLAIPFSYTLLGTDQAWLLHAWEASAFVGPGTAQHFEVANWLYDIRQQAEGFQSLTAWTSALLAISGLVLAYVVYHLFNGRGEFYNANFNYKRRYARLSHHNLYLDALYELTLVRLGRVAAKLVCWLDSRVLDRLINSLGMGTVIMSHMLAWVDRVLVDGLVSLGVWTVGRGGQVVRGVQNGHIQRYLIILSAAVILLLLWWVV